MAGFTNQFSWSKSRDEKLKDCPRAYYFNHYGFWGGWDYAADPRTREIYVLKNLKSRQMWVGELVHHIVEIFLKDFQQSQAKPSDFYIQQLTQRMRQEFRASRDKFYRQKPKSGGLLEHEYEWAVTDQDWKDIHANALACASFFFENIFPKRVQNIPLPQWKLIETMQEFFFDGVKVYVKIDFAYEADGVLYIVDWKTGKLGEERNEIQLDCYGLFSSQYFKLPYEKIKTVECNLKHGEEVERQFLPEHAVRAHEYLTQSINHMKTYLTDVEKNTPIAEVDFPMTENEWSCRRCNYKKVCLKFVAK